MDRSQQGRRFRRAAAEHHVTAKILLKERRYLHSMYHAGYVVECAFKALILAGTPDNALGETVRRFYRGQAGHNLDLLRKRLGELGYNMGREQADHFRRLNTWTTDLRYDVVTINARDADVYLQAAVAILRWVENRL